MAAVEKERLEQSPVAISQPTAVVYVVEEPPQDFLMLSILMLVCCFWPLGIIAVYMSLMARDKLSQGDIVSARKASRWARALSFVGITIGLVIYIVATFVAVIIALIAATFCNSIEEREGKC
ncbi:proline-rich transmembrane protein 1-like [Corticium candelabrum]|uniref:proline-rich transmembrane protein 1-like n=1 Tax=Corticium candelabrum TaxID=121492 RepID=UPI002E265479|nr:proline-rich transmembrane protein 1-like [Corticium candelabrum]